MGKCRGTCSIIKCKKAAFSGSLFYYNSINKKQFDMEAIVNNVPQEIYEQIKAEITNKDSVVGIDALHTHILVLHRLMQIEAKLDALNEKLNAAKTVL
jgi:hypothetical protein